MEDECGILDNRTRHQLLLPHSPFPNSNFALKSGHQLLATRRIKIRRSLLIPCDNQLAADFIEFINQAQHRGSWFLNCSDY